MAACNGILAVQQVQHHHQNIDIAGIIHIKFIIYINDIDVIDANWLFVEMMPSQFFLLQSISDHQIAEDLSEERKEEERNYFEVILANESIAEGGNFGKSEWVMLLAIIF